MSQPDERMAELRELFFESAQELLQSLNDEALKLEKHPGDSEIVRSLRRIVHTLKGDAAACGYRELSEVAHELEDALALESAATHATLAEVAFTAADLFAAMLAAYRKHAKLPARDALRKMVKKLSAEPGTKRGAKKKATVSAQALGWTEYEKLAVQKGAGRRQLRVPRAGADRPALRDADCGTAAGPECAGRAGRSARGASGSGITGCDQASGIPGRYPEDGRGDFR